MNEQLKGYAEEIKVLFRSILKNFRNNILSEISDFNFTVPQLHLMQELYSHPEITLKELSERLGLAKSTVCGIVDRLEVQGAVVRTRALEDRRTVNISLSPQMLELTEALNIVKGDYLAGLLAEVEKDEIEKIIDGLKKLNCLMEKNKKTNE